MKIEEFLIEAKINTYASNGEKEEKQLDNGGKELIYKKGEWEYRDIFFGFNPFVGEEIVLNNGKTVWVMNYCGRVISDTDPKEVYRFLKSAMRLVKIERPFRGPSEFIDNEWRYCDKSFGDINYFDGVEEIYFSKEKVYELKYHGGKT